MIAETICKDCLHRVSCPVAHSGRKVTSCIAYSQEAAVPRFRKIKYYGH